MRIPLKIMSAMMLGVAMFGANAHAAANSWSIDDVHSSIGFSVSHLLVSQTKGEFETFSGTLNIDPAKFTKSEISVEVDVASINTRNEKRDEHLRSGDFFAAQEHPKATFVSKSIKKAKGKGKYKVTGDFTLKGVTKSVTLDTTVTGPVKGFNGKSVLGISASTSLNRQDFGVSWNKTLDTGGVAVGDVVAIEIALELHEK